MNTGISAILLAAGNSRRFGTVNKLLVEIDGCPLIRRVAEAIVRAELAVVVVTGSDRLLVERALSDLPLSFVHNAGWPKGMGSSIAVGIGALSPEIDGVMIVPGDMPFLTDSVIRTLVEVFEEGGRTSVVVPVTAGEQRNPVLWPRRFFWRLKSLTGPAGGKVLLKAQSLDSRAVKFQEEKSFQDVDTPHEMATALVQLESRRQVVQISF